MTEYNKVTQLEIMIKEWYKDIPAELDDVTPIGVIIDYLSLSNKSLLDVFNMNPAIYRNAYLQLDNDGRDNLLLATLRENSHMLEVYASNKALNGGVTTLALCESAERIINERYSCLDDSISAIELLNRCLNCGHIMLWHISDLHFGKLSKWTPEDIAGILATAATEKTPTGNEVTPSYVLITGDVTSFCKKTEFDSFNRFCKELAIRIWQNAESGQRRIIVLPGNHDMKWKKNGKTDMHKDFINNLLANEYCITPFSSVGTYNNGQTAVKRVNYPSETKDLPPLTIVACNDCGTDIMLLVSSYHSGAIESEKLRKLKELEGKLGSGTAANDLNDFFMNYVREDNASLDQRYLYAINTLDEAVYLNNKRRIVATHHNFGECGDIPQMSNQSPALLQYLRNKSFEYLVHGHIHKAPYWKPEATLHSIPYCSARGAFEEYFSFNIYALNPNEKCFHILEWKINGGRRFFTLDDIQFITPQVN